MELRHLRYFVAVAEEENVSRAALKLHVSQPALSRQIRDLEDEIGFSLLERSAKSVHLTQAGHVFLIEARAVLERAEDAVKTARVAAAGGHRELHIGYAPSLTAQILPPALRAFQAEMPKVRVALHDLTTEEMLEGLREGKLHLAFLVRPSTATRRLLNFEELARIALRVAVAPNHALARRRSVKLAEVAKQPLIGYSREGYPEYHKFLEELFAESNLKPNMVEEHDSVTSLIAAVEAGYGVALAPESLSCFAGPRVKLAALVPEPAPIIVGAAWPKDKRNPTAERFLKLAKDSAAKA